MPVSEEFKNYAAELGYPDSETMIRILQNLFYDEDDVRLFKALPGTAQELAERSGMPLARAREIADRLKSRGAVGTHIKKPDVYRLFKFMIELRDSSLLNPEAPQLLFELWDRLVINESQHLAAEKKIQNLPPKARVIPIESTIKAQQKVLDIDSATKIFRDAELISVIPCICRAVARRNGRGQDCPAPATSVCMQTNGFAAVTLKRGVAEQISNAEALKRLADAEAAGLVHQTLNSVTRDTFMCNCCACCCTSLFFINQLGLQEASPSRFRVTLNIDACSGCGLCEDRCQFDAIKMNGGLSIDLDKCYGCGNCVITCPEAALTLEEVRPQEHIRIK